MAVEDFDVVVVGSGFGGSVAALRLSEKGYKVAVLEAGRRFDDSTLPRTSWRLSSFFWAPRLRLFGIQRICLLRNVIVLAGAGVGGGSLVYGNTLYEPFPAFFSDERWSHITDWADELKPFFDLARRMLGVVENPSVTAADEAMRAVAEEMGAAKTFVPTPVGVFFGKPGLEVPDPYFGGAGPPRTGCIECGECMTGCRHGAKNSLTKNYLHLAEQMGAEILPLSTVTAVEPRPDGRYEVKVEASGSLLLKDRRSFVARDVVLAAGALGTQKLLHSMRDAGKLTRLSPRLGELTRSNSEAILGARTFSKATDFSRGIAITSSFYPDAQTHVEPVRYGRGSNAMGLLATALADGDRRSRLGAWAREMARHPVTTMRSLSLRHWSEQTIVALVMQPRDNSMTCYTKKGLFGRRLTTRQGHGEPNPTWIPVGHEVVRRLARHIGGYAAGGWNDVFNVPMTAHLLGGAVIGDSPDNGVIDPYHRVYGHPGLHVVDGAAVSANLGVNPSLTITAQAERAMALWPNKGEADPRAPLGEPYRRAAPVVPRSAAVPAGAPGALRFPR